MNLDGIRSLYMAHVDGHLRGVEHLSVAQAELLDQPHPDSSGIADGSGDRFDGVPLVDRLEMRAGYLQPDRMLLGIVDVFVDRATGGVLREVGADASMEDAVMLKHFGDNLGPSDIFISAALDDLDSQHVR